MRVDELRLRQFRNYREADVQFCPSVNLLVGENAQGKTNILEAIYLAAMGQSHRGADDTDLIGWQSDSASLEVFFVSQTIESTIRFFLSKSQKKEIRLNGQPTRLREMIGTLNAVLFSPEDLWLVKGAPAVRRRFLDNEISQANPVYYRQLLQYQHTLLQRNNLLKKIRERQADPGQLEVWDEQFVRAAANVTAKRLAAVKKLTMLANLMHRKITGSKENLSINYQIHHAVTGIPESVPELAHWYAGKLQEMKDHDLFRGSTGIGPHRDDLQMEVNGKNLRVFGSQGQQRTGVLSLKLAELEFIKSETGEYPVLLLDDVMSELDVSRREHLLSFIKNRIQTFITATDATYFPPKFAGKQFIISHGTVRE